MSTTPPDRGSTPTGSGKSPFASTGLPPPSKESWEALLKRGDGGTGGEEAASQWVADFIKVCRRYPIEVTESHELNSQSDVAPLRDWNHVYQTLQSWVGAAVVDEALSEQRSKKLEAFIAEFKELGETLVETVVSELPLASKSLPPIAPVREGPNGLPQATYQCGNLVVHLSPEPRLPSRVVRHCSSISSSTVGLSAPLCQAYYCRGCRVLVAAKVPVVEELPEGSAQATGVLRRLASDLNVTTLNLRGAKICVGSDTRLYCIPGLSMYPTDIMGSTIRYELAVRNGPSVCTPELAYALTKAATSSLVQELRDAPLVPEDFDLSFELHLRGIPLGTGLGELLEHPDIAGSDEIRPLLVTEMAARVVRQLSVALKDWREREATDEQSLNESINEMNFLFHHALTDTQGWYDLVAPLLVLKYSLKQPPTLERGQRQGLLRRMCEMLGVATSGQQVSALGPVLMVSCDPIMPGLLERALREDNEESLVSLVESVKERGDTIKWRHALFRLASYYSGKADRSPQQADGWLQKASEAYRNIEEGLTGLLEDAGLRGDTQLKYEVAETMVSLARAKVALGRRRGRLVDPDEALGLLGPAVSTRQALFGKRKKDLHEVIDYSSFLVACSRCLVQLGEFDELAEKVQPQLVEVLGLLDQHMSYGDLWLPHAVEAFAPVLQQLSRVTLEMNHLEEAERYASRELQLWLDVSRSRIAEEVGMAATELANIQVALGKLVDAKKHFHTALSVYRKVHGEAHPLTATALNNLAYLLIVNAKQTTKELPSHRRLGREMDPAVWEDFNEATDLLLKIMGLPVEVLNASHEGNDSFWADALNNLASVHHLKGEF
eukprot:Sspe_Gene.67636::Locus_39909_Transcript_1_1_Confidence_1.000_Length_2565::g.67636::m.67636